MRCAPRQGRRITNPHVTPTWQKPPKWAGRFSVGEANREMCLQGGALFMAADLWTERRRSFKIMKPSVL